MDYREAEFLDDFFTCAQPVFPVSFCANFKFFPRFAIPTGRHEKASLA
jgi:hypothetical protein